MKVEERYHGLVEAMDRDHRRLVRLCARLAGQSQVAEDLAQETLVEAWRNREKWTGTGSAYAWLSRIAVNICWRWRRRQGRDSAHTVAALPEVLEQSALAPDWQRELDQAELLTLLDRSLAHLPEATRSLLVAKYVDDASLTELSARFGATTGAVAVRLHRGRQALQEVLQTHFREEAVAYGLATEEETLWVETKLWCAGCGQAHLQALRHPDNYFYLRCPRCFPALGQYFESVDLGTQAAQRIIKEARGFRTIQTRLDAAGYRYCQQALLKGHVPCAYCGKPTKIELLGQGREPYTLGMRCAHCTAPTLSISLGRLLLGVPEAQAFWRANPRLRRLPDQELLLEGTPVVRTRFESITGTAALELFSRREDFRLLAVREDRGI